MNTVIYSAYEEYLLNQSRFNVAFYEPLKK